MADTAPSAKSEALKRRSTRIVQAVPLAVTGIDALGRPFEERTSTSILNCHGCRYQSKHYVLKNMWVTLEVPNPEPGRQPRMVRARVMWIQRPRTVRELFQVGVELEVPGNIWGIAFCPPDWFPFPESGIHVAAPPPGALLGEANEAMPAENATWSGAPEPGSSTDNVRTMPMASPVADSSEPSPALAQPPARLNDEALQQLRAEVRDYAAESVAAEARRLLASLQSQLQEASDKAAQAATLAAAEKAVEGAMAKSEAVAEERMRSLADHLNEEFGRNVEQRYERLAAQFAEIEPASRDALSQHLQTQLNEGLGRLQAAAQGATETATKDSLAALELSRENLERLRREMEGSASTTLEECLQHLKAQAEDARLRVAELENVQRQVIDRITSVSHSADSDWQARLEASTAAAASHWNDRLGASSELAAQQLAERLAVNSLLAREQFEKELGDRIAGTNKALQDASTDAENRLGAARASFDSQIAQVQSLFTQVQASAQALAEQAGQIEAARQAAEEEVQKRAAALVELHSQELARNGENAVAAWTGRLQPALEAAGQQTVTRLGAQLEEELNSQLSRASLMLGRLESQSLAAGELEQQLAAKSAETIDAATVQLQKQLDALRIDFQEGARGSVQRCLAEIESKANETTHATFESLFKTSDWYEKKVQTQMQSTLEKGLEQGVQQLREKAGEISRVFAGELDHYSRSYVEHTQGQIEEAGREAQERAKKLTQELTVSTVYATSQQMQGRAEATLADFQGTMVATLGKLAAQMEEQAARTRAELQAITQRTSTDYGAALAQQAQQAVGSVRNELTSQAESARDQLRAESDERQKQLREALAGASEQGIAAYQQRLESAANSWLLTTASKLNQQSTQQLEALTHTAEARLSETCKQVFARVGDALHMQMLDLTSPHPTGTPPSAASPSASAPPPNDSEDQTLE